MDVLCVCLNPHPHTTTVSPLHIIGGANPRQSNQGDMFLINSVVQLHIQNIIPLHTVFLCIICIHVYTFARVKYYFNHFTIINSRSKHYYIISTIFKEQRYFPNCENSKYVSKGPSTL